MRDVFRPRHEPARTLYDAFQTEAEKRPGRSYEEWVAAEREAVWRAAKDYAQQNWLAVPTLDAVTAAERQAFGHTDFGAKWAYAVADVLQRIEETPTDG